MKLSQEILEYIDAHEQENYDLLLELAQIPAPSNKEHLRAEFCKKWLEEQGARGVYIDEALNVICPIGCDGDKPIAVFVAHSDVVFPDMESLPLKVEDGYIHCPGVGDDTGNVTALMTVAKYIAQRDLKSADWGILLVINSGEEGLGNLKGTRRLFADYGSRVREFVTFDLGSNRLYDRAVGSRRFRISVKTQGGHSLNDFGRPNAIACLSELIHTLYQVKVPEKGRTTYNVGTISGGTSVNTIAQNAEMLYEFRSDERESMDIMQNTLDNILKAFRSHGMDISCQVVGDRPCSGEVDAQHQACLSDRAAKAAKDWFGQEPLRLSASTDCNIPLSMGIPSVCIGCLLGEGEHTRQEKVKISSLLPGLKLAFQLVLHYF